MPIAGITPYHDIYPSFVSADGLSTALALRWAPRPGIEVTAFVSRIRQIDKEAQPLILTSGAFLPNRHDRKKFYGQSSNDTSLTIYNFGLVARADPLGFKVRLGVFRSIFDGDNQAADLLFGTDPTGRVARWLIMPAPGLPPPPTDDSPGCTARSAPSTSRRTSRFMRAIRADSRRARSHRRTLSI